MKVIIDTEDGETLDALAAALAAKLAPLLGKAPAAEAPKAADKPAGKPAAASKAPAAGKGKGVKREDVLAALRAHAAAHTTEAAMKVLNKYAPTVADLKETDFQKVLDGLKAEPEAEEETAETEEDPFG